MKTLRKIGFLFIGALIALLSYFGVWAIKYRMPVEEPLVIDLRHSTDDAPRCISFCGSLASNLIGFPGHAYVVWSPSLDVDINRDHSMGFMPRYFRDQVPSLFAPVEGAVISDLAGNTRNLDRMTVIVSEEDYRKTAEAASQWNSKSFQVGQRDCVAFVCSIAHVLNLNGGQTTNCFPQDYIRQLKKINQTS